MYRVIYNSNNSGGGWWLEDKDWQALEDAGWTVHWKPPGQGLNHGDMRAYDFDICLDKTTSFNPDASYLGAKARSAAKEFASLDEAISEWEDVTGERASDEGCNCCGPPHEFSYRNEETGKKGYGQMYVKETAFLWE